MQEALPRNIQSNAIFGIIVFGKFEVFVGLNAPMGEQIAPPIFLW